MGYLRGASEGEGATVGQLWVANEDLSLVVVVDALGRYVYRLECG
jgi:hypothetical protein